jgi:hypothetical protein
MQRRGDPFGIERLTIWLLAASTRRSDSVLGALRNQTALEVSGMQCTAYRP